MPDPLRVEWKLLSQRGIQLDDSEEVWNSGCVRDVLPISAQAALVAADTGGIWLVGETGVGLSLADLQSPNLRCLGKAQTQTQGAFRYFAGGDELYQSEDTNGSPKNWVQVSRALAAGGDTGQINQIVYDPDVNTLLLATSNGVFWAVMPASPSPAYAWRRAVDGAGRGVKGDFYSVGLARRPPGLVRSIVATRSTPASGGAFLAGQWNPTSGGPQLKLVLTPSTVPANATLLPSISRAALAVCVGNPYVVYSSPSRDDGKVACIMRSDDGGTSWNLIDPKLPNPPTSGTFRDVAGNQGDGDRANNCLAVSPINQKILILGWRRGAVFLSRDGGETFSTQSEVPPFHSDIHAIVFDPFDHNNKRLYIASDGGVVRVDGLAQDVGSANSLFNSHLPILQFDSRPGRMFFASFGGPVNGEFLGGGTQDTCMLYAPVRPQVAPWRPLQGRTATGDGHDLIGIEKLGAVYTYNTGPKPRLAWWDSTTQKFIYIEREIPITSGREIYWSLNRDPKEALVDAMMVALETPFTAPASARRIIALAVRDQVIFGLSIGAGGADPGWEALFGPVIVDATKMVNQQPNVSAMHSLNGSPILLGYVGGAVVQWSYSRPTVDRTRQYALPAALLKKPNATSDDPVITHVAAVNQQLAYAVLKSSNGSTTLFKLVGDSGVQTLATGRNDTVYSLTVVPMRQSVALFVAYDDKVLVSENEGGTWRDASNGLPKCPHSSTLCYLPNTAGDGDLYLSTYGRSVWKTQLLR